MIVPITYATGAVMSRPTQLKPRIPRGLLVGVLAVLVLTWGLYLIQPGGSILSAQEPAALYAGLRSRTISSPRARARVVRTGQRYALNPLFRLLLAVGLNPLGLAILETRGH